MASRVTSPQGSGFLEEFLGRTRPKEKPGVDPIELPAAQGELAAEGHAWALREIAQSEAISRGLGSRWLRWQTSRQRCILAPSGLAHHLREEWALTGWDDDIRSPQKRHPCCGIEKAKGLR